MDRPRGSAGRAGRCAYADCTH